MTLSTSFLLNQPIKNAVNTPDSALLQLPEKVLQFGTGVLLRGLPDYFIDKANRQGIFNGRIVVVKSTDGGDLSAFRKQDNLYTLCIRGIEQGETVEENVICSAISRVLSAKSEWAEVLQFATSPDLQLVLSNTTEVGIQLVQDDIRQSPPQSFPGKLLAVLYARYLAFGGDPDRGLVIVPTELIPDNGTKLDAILLELAHRNGLETEFIDWLESANTCCNSLVDRIVPGLPDASTRTRLENQLGYTDELLTVAESFRLWAIQADVETGGEKLRSALSFRSIDQGIWVQPNIDLFRELKLRLLNGTHTLCCGLAFLEGFNTVSEAMQDEAFATFAQNLMLSELLPGIPYPVEEKMGQQFALDVLDRFRNPYIDHRWMAITVNYSTKMQMRNSPTLLHFYQQFDTVPRTMALGFAAYLLFMRGVEQRDGAWYGERNGETYPIQDDKAAYFAQIWREHSPLELTQSVLQNRLLWGHDLTKLPHFSEAVGYYLTQLLADGVKATVANLSVQQNSTITIPQSA